GHALAFRGGGHDERTGGASEPLGGEVGPRRPVLLGGRGGRRRDRHQRVGRGPTPPRKGRDGGERGCAGGPGGVVAGADPAVEVVAEVGDHDPGDEPQDQPNGEVDEGFGAGGGGGG